MTNTRKMAPPNKMFTTAMVDRIQAFVAAQTPPISIASVTEMLMDEFGAFFEDQKVYGWLYRHGIKLSRAPSPIRDDPAILTRIRERIATHPAACGNVDIVKLIADEFGLSVTEGQVAGAIRRAGIVRTGIRKGVRRSRPVQNIPVTAESRCVECQAPFVSRKVWQRFCSASCKVVAATRRRDQRRAEQRSELSQGRVSPPAVVTLPKAPATPPGASPGPGTPPYRQEAEAQARKRLDMLREALRR